MTTQPDASVKHHPVVLAHQARRAADVQLRIADAITNFAGSMRFVYIHAAVFALWMLLVESDPWPKLTLAVSLEAIFLSTFVMIGQNRQAAFQQAKADHDFVAQEQELRANTQITRAIHALTTEIHTPVVRSHDAQGNEPHDQQQGAKRPGPDAPCPIGCDSENLPGNRPVPTGSSRRRVHGRGGRGDRLADHGGDSLGLRNTDGV
jgi:uncharacterized membrane protein